MLKENLGIAGTVNITLLDDNGNFIERFVHSNLIVDTGKNIVAKRLIGVSTPIISHIAIGSNQTFQTVGDTALFVETARQPITSTEIQNNILKVFSSFPAGIGTGTINEIGIFDSTNNGVMFSRSTFQTITKLINQQFIVEWQFVIG
jgi:hypothetical protein